MMKMNEDRSLMFLRPGRQITIETPYQRAVNLISVGWRAVVAYAVATGEIENRVRAIKIARLAGLISKPDVGEARQRGLVR